LQEINLIVPIGCENINIEQRNRKPPKADAQP
jgi:hypothetical protein